MIVFTATSQVNHKVFVGSCRTDLEEHWITLVNQAEDGVEGPFFSAIRHDGPDSFDVEEYGFAEDGAEMRELVREAQTDLGAQQIKAVRSSSVIKKSAKVEKIDLKELEESGSEWDEEPVSDWLEERRTESSPSEPVSEPQPKTELSSLDLVKSALQDAALEFKPKSSAKPKVAPKVKSTHKTTAKAQAQSEAPKLSSGRTSSSSKEKRIKEAIAAEREARLMQRQTQSTQEAQQMKEVMLAIEARRLANKQKAKETREKAAKAQRAEQRAAEKARKQSKKALQTDADDTPQPITVSKKILSQAAVSRADIKAEAARLVAQTRAEQAEQDKQKEKPSAEDARALARAHAMALRANKADQQPSQAKTAPTQLKPETAQPALSSDMANMLARLNERAASGERGRRRR